MPESQYTSKHLPSLYGALLVVLFLTAIPPNALCLVRFGFEQRYLVIPGRYMKDRCFIKDSGIWHCFMIIGNDSALGWQVPGNEITFAHASTPDFRHWNLHPDILSTGTGEWDERNIWAPDIIRQDGMYRLYYTGVDSSIAQRMGVAESADLFLWQPHPANPIYRPDTSWADWEEGRWSNCRDPDILRIGDSLHCFSTVSVKEGFGAVGQAVSYDGILWFDRGPLFVNDTWAVLESVQLIEHNGFWYLFFNEHGVLGVSVMQASTMEGPWDKATRRVISLGQAQEILGDQPATLISRHKTYRVGEDIKYVMKIDSLRWGEDGYPSIPGDNVLWDEWSPLDLDDPDPLFGEAGFGILETDSAFAYQPTFGENPSFRGEPVRIGHIGNSWIGTREAYRGPLTGTTEGMTVGDEALGGIRSRDFVVEGSEITYFIGGDSDSQNLYVALCDAADHTVLRSETGTGREELEQRSWWVGDLLGMPVYLKIVDASTSGHLNLDEIVEDGCCASHSQPFPGVVFAPYPNPVSAGLYGAIRLNRPSRLHIELVDVTGRLVRSIYSGEAGIGLTRYFWDGYTDCGHRAASGVYFVYIDAEGVHKSKKVILLR
ncbi:MAG: T9SS type A sorting domain-containing protein [bacterium]|nr:MAG: T9SS type A sorting domain-containing protein [bacterium]